MSRFRTVALATAALCFSSQALAQTAKPCVTAAEAKGLITFALPDLIDAVGKTCQPALPADAFLSRSGKDFSARYRAHADSSWPAAKAAIAKIAGKDGAMFASLPDEATKALIGVAISSELGSKVKAKDCGTVSAVLEQLSPLPPANTSNLIGIIMEAALAGKSGNSSLNICPTASSATASK